MIISTPSYVIKGTYLENVRYISTMEAVRSVELLFFLYDDDTEKLLLEEREALKRFLPDLQFTVHMPDILEPRHEALIEATEDFSSLYILHPPDGDPGPFAELVNEWISRYGKRFLLENLIERDFSGTLALFDDDVGICCDCGHLLLRGETPKDFLERYGARIREVHLHGIEDGWDHKPFSANEKWFSDIVPFLQTYEGVLNMELFKVDDVNKVLQVLYDVELLR